MTKITSQEMKNDLIQRFEEARQYEENGNLEMAEEVTLAILDDYPGQPHAIKWLGFYALRTGDYRRAVPLLNEAHHADPSDFDVVVGLGRAMVESALHNDARVVFERALKMKPGDGETTLALANIYLRVGEAKKSEKLYNSLLVEHPNDPNALVGLAQIARAQGNTKKALDLARRSTEANPLGVDARLIFTDMQKFKELPPEFEDMKELADRYESGTRSSVSLRFAMGKILDDIGAYEEAFQAFRAANEEVESPYNPVMVEKRIGTHIEVFSPSFFERCKGFGSSSERPVFIVGMPRSGTSLAEQILASHPDVFGAGELQHFADMKIHVLPKYVGVGQPFPESLRDLSGEGFMELADYYLEKSAERAGDAVRITDKFPHNFVNLGLIAVLFPKAKIIHCQRDPMDTCLSIYVRNFSDSYEFATRLDYLGHQYNQYRRIMAHWKKVLPIDIFDVQYEEVTADQEGVSRRMVDFIDLPWDDQCLSFNTTKREVNTFSHWQVRQPIYRSSVAKWKKYEPWLGPLKSALEAEA